MERGMVLVKQCLRIIWEAQYKLDGKYSKKTTLKFWMLENPAGLLRYFLGNPPLIYDPFEFGDNYRKKTCVWGFYNMPKKNPIECTAPKFDRLASKQIHFEGYEHLNRTERRSICSPGFAKAFFNANK